MKTFIATIKLNNLVFYEDEVKAPCKWIARIILKTRNSGKIVNITIL